MITIRMGLILSTNCETRAKADRRGEPYAAIRVAGGAVVAGARRVPAKPFGRRAESARLHWYLNSSPPASKISQADPPPARLAGRAPRFEMDRRDLFWFRIIVPISG
jgi:hypothetical protein